MKNKTGSLKTSARDVFAYLLMIVMLYVGIFSFIALLWQYVNVLFPDALNFYYSSATDAIRRSMASLVVVWPVLIGISWMIYKDLRENTGKRDLWVRKWSLYLTLFIASMTIVVDLIALIYNFLGGELTTRFVLKVAVVLAVALGVFGYYLWDLRRVSFEGSRTSLIAAVTSSVFVLAAIIAGFFIVGTPAEQRAIRLDEQRVMHLQQLQTNLVNYWSERGELPAEVNAAQDSYHIAITVDPETEEPYGYERTGALTFELCATFETDSSEVRNEHFRMAVPYGHEYGIKREINWEHGRGYTCFEREIDPEVRKPSNPIR